MDKVVDFDASFKEVCELAEKVGESNLVFAELCKESAKKCALICGNVFKHVTEFEAVLRSDNAYRLRIEGGVLCETDSSSFRPPTNFGPICIEESWLEAFRDGWNPKCMPETLLISLHKALTKLLEARE